MSKHIFVDCHVFDGNFQGTTTYIKGLYTEFIKQKKFQFFLGSNNPEKLHSIFGTHENVFYLKYNSKNKFIRLLVEVPYLIKKYKINYAHFQYIVPPVKFCKYIVTTHDILFLDYPSYFPLSYRVKNKLLFKLSAKYSDVVLTVSEFSKKQIDHHFKIKDVTITPNSVEPIFFEDYDKLKYKQQVKIKYNLDEYWIYISRKEPRKNHDKLIEVFVEGNFYKKYQLVLVGSEAIANKKYANYIAHLPVEIKSKIISLNKVNFNDLLELLRGADLSVYPSIAEGFGIPPLEAIAASVSSVCSNTTAMADFNFMSEYLFDPHDKKAIKKAIELALSKPIDSNLKKNLLEKYNWKDSLSNLIERIKSEDVGN